MAYSPNACRATAVTRKATFRRLLESPIAGPLITLVAFSFFFSLFVPHFLQCDSMSGIVNAATLTGIVTIGVTLLMISGEFDLSVGPMMAWGAYLFGSLIQRRQPPILALVLGLLVPSLLGAVNGAIFNRTGIPSFIVTLGTQFIYRGALWVFSGGIMLQTIAKTLPIYTFFNGRLEWLASSFQERISAPPCSGCSAWLSSSSSFSCAPGSAITSCPLAAIRARPLPRA